MAKKVIKALTPEEKTIVDNLKSMLAQLEGAAAGQAAGEMVPDDEGVDMALKAVEGMAGRPENEELGAEPVSTTPGKKVMGQVVPVKKAVSTDKDVPGAEDDAEDRIEEIPDVDEDNIKEVAKQLAPVIAKMLAGRGIRKAAPSDPLTLVVQAMTKLANEVSVVKEAQVKLLEGLGVADQIAALEKVEKDEANARRPVGSLDHQQVTDMVAKALADAMQRVGGGAAQESLSDVRKDLAGVLQQLGGNNLWNPGLGFGR